MIYIFKLRRPDGRSFFFRTRRVWNSLAACSELNRALAGVDFEAVSVRIV